MLSFIVFRVLDPDVVLVLVELFVEVWMGSDGSE
jgi:hypothetical protein